VDPQKLPPQPEAAQHYNKQSFMQAAAAAWDELQAKLLRHPNYYGRLNLEVVLENGIADAYEIQLRERTRFKKPEAQKERNRRF
jgi:hypothetical protein